MEKNKIIENNGQYEIIFCGHTFTSYTRSHRALEIIAAERGWSVEDTTDIFLRFIFHSLNNNEVIHY